MQTWNYLVDIWFQKEETAVPTNWTAPYLSDITNITQPKVDPSKSPEYEKWGLQNQEEFDLMKYVKDTWWSSDDFTFILEDFRSKTKPDFANIWTPEVPEAPEVEEEISWLDIWVKTWTAISEFWSKAKFFQSDVDDNIIESGLKFFGNLPGSTLQLAWDIISLAADPAWTIESVWTLAKAWIETWLNKMFLAEWEEIFTSEEVEQVADAVWAEFNKLWEPWRIKELLVENPADVLLALTWGLWVAKNVAKAKNLTWLASKLEKAEKLTNPIKLQADLVKWTTKAIGVWTAKVTEKLIDTTIKFTPTQTTKVTKATWGTSPSKWLLEKGIIDDVSITKGKEWIVTKLDDINRDSYNKLNVAVADAKGLFKSKEIDKAMWALEKQLFDVPGMETKAWRVSELLVKGKNEWLTLTEQLEVKRLIDSTLDLYKVSWDPKAWVIKEWLINIRRWVREAIESEAIMQWLWDVKAISNDIQVSRLIKDNLVNRIEAWASTRAISLTDIIVWWTVWARTWDIWTTLAILAGKKIIESTPFKLFAVKTLRLPQTLINKIGKWTLTVKENLAISNAVQEFINQEWTKIADIIK